jgi:Flp pilus assembly protein TadD
LLLVKGDVEGAIAEFSETIRLNPDDDRCHYFLACAYAEKGDAAKAIASLRRAIELNPASKQEAAKDDDFNFLRTNPEFQRLVGK